MRYFFKSLLIILLASSSIFASADFNETHFSSDNFRMFLESIEEQQVSSVIVNDRDVYNPSDFEEDNIDTLTTPPVSTQGPILIGAINGGGVKGIVPAKCLSRLVSIFGKPITDIFDVLAGTSTGSLIAGGLTAVDDDQENIMTPRITKSLYKKKASTIFTRTWGETVLNPLGLRGPLYKSDRLNNVLEDYLYDTPFNQTKIPTIITTYNLTTGKGKVFCSHHLKNNAVVRNLKYNSLMMRDVIGASCAAPGFFEPKKLHIVKESGHEEYIDGCLLAFNPAEVAYHKAKKLYPNREIFVISFGTGYSQYKAQASSSWGTLEWTKYFAMQMLKSQDVNVDDRLERKLNKPGQQKHYYKIDFEVNFDCRFDNGSAKNMNYLNGLGLDITQSQDFSDIVNLISTIKSLKSKPKRVY